MGSSFIIWVFLEGHVMRTCLHDIVSCHKYIGLVIELANWILYKLHFEPKHEWHVTSSKLVPIWVIQKLLLLLYNIRDITTLYVLERACQRMHIIDSIWFRATESPMKANVLFLINSRNFLALNLGRSHCEGFHRQFSYSLSGLPFPWQFCICVRIGHELGEYNGPLVSYTHFPWYKSQPTI